MNTTLSTEPTPAPQNGIPLDLFGHGAQPGEDIHSLLTTRTFIGIDFGTSTTVVSRIALDPESNALLALPVPIPQFDEQGLCTEDALVPSCLAWTGKSLLVGQGAARLKARSDYEYEKNLWFSFKMKLGIDLGPQYYRTDLPRGNPGPVIEKPRDAATAFFRYLREQIERFLHDHHLPPDVVYAVSVPAAFEANQRQDLCQALKDAQIELPECGIIDEPNAAFISYLLETMKAGPGIAEAMRERKRKVLVFDFGAGTCDISILEVAADDNHFTSKNLALSQFHALGGDDIDRHIARHALLDQLTGRGNPDAEFTSAELDTLIIPRLQPAAESLKIQCCKFIASNWNGANLDPFLTQDTTVSAPGIEPFSVAQTLVRLETPTLSYAAFAEILQPFLTRQSARGETLRAEGDAISIFEPILNALEKAGLAPEDLDMILLIGGSSANPIVQHAIKVFFGRFVETVALPDLRTPVSRGAAIYSFMVNGLKREVIRPITSESIHLVTCGGGLRLLLPAGADIPSTEVVIADLAVTREQQAKVELPICVTSADKVLGVIEIPAPADRPFTAGNTLHLTCRLDANKLLHIRAEIAGCSITGALINPLANKALTEKDRHLLAARSQLNLSALGNQGRPSFEAMLCYAHACAAAGQHLKAAEAFASAEWLAAPDSCNFAVSICYHYSKACKSILSDKWAVIAHQRQPGPASAFNLALTRKRQGDLSGFETLMRQALKLNPDYEPALELYGDYLNREGNPLGIGMIQRAFDSLYRAFELGALAPDDRFRLRRAAGALGRQDVIARIDAPSHSVAGERPYLEENLVSAANTDDSIKAGGSAS